MRLTACIALVLVIMEGSFCIPSTSVETTGSSWGYEYNLNDSRGFSAKYDNKNGFQIFPLDTKNNTGFHKKYTERTVQDQYTSKDDQPATHQLTVNEYIETNKPASTDGKAISNPNGTSPDNSKTVSSTTMSSTTSSPYEYVDSRGSSAPKPPSNRVPSLGEPGTPMNKVPSPRGQSGMPSQNAWSTNNVQPPVGQSGTPANNVPLPLGQPGTPATKPVGPEPGNQGYPAYGAHPHRVPVGNLPDSPNVATFSTPYGYNMPLYRPFGAPVYNKPNLIYGVPDNQMYTSWQGRTGSANGPTGYAYAPTGSATGLTGSAYGTTGPVYRPDSLRIQTPSWSTHGLESGQTYGPQYDHNDQTYMRVRRPLYGMPQRIYY